MRGPATAPVEAYLSRLRRRAALLHGARAGVAVMGAGGVAFAIGALTVGPLGSPVVAFLAWVLVAAVAAAVTAWAWRAFAPFRGAGAAQLLREVGGELPSAARSAYELAQSPPPQASASMIRAHEARVRAVLAEIPPARVVRWRWLRHRAVALGIAGVALTAAVLSSERGGAGAYALVHPGERDAEGARVAVAFGDVEAHLVYPSYLDRESTTVLDPSVLEVPRGTSVELRARPRLPSSAASMRVGERDTPLELGDDGRYFGRFVAREDGSLDLRLRHDDGDWVHDATERTVRALEDEAPRVTLVDPSEDLVLHELEEVSITWDVTDDVGIASLELVIRDPDGHESRRRLASYDESERPMQSTGSAPLDLRLLGVRAGDSVTVYLEARDSDVVSGPNVGTSPERTITLASEATQREERLEELQALVDRSIHLLADRLEHPVPEAEEASRERHAGLAGPTRELIAALGAFVETQREEDARASDIALVREMISRVRRLLHEEGVAHGRRIASLRDREDVDTRSGTELENDVLTLDDLLGRARVEDAASIARELEQLRREIRSLLSELRRTESPEARQRLLAAIGRAQARMRELAQRIAEMGTSVPQEFMNQGEMSTEATADSLAQMREAVERGDLERAEQLASELERQIDRLASALGNTEQSFVESRFGPRERAIANAMMALGGLETEQQQLSGRGTARRGRAAERALEAIGGRDNRIGNRLADETHGVREALERIERDDLAGYEQDGFDRARQRLIDAEDALRAGDLGEGRRMAQTAAQDLSMLSRDLDLNALMFPGHEGETSSDAREARDADRRLRELRRGLDEALPDVSAHVDGHDRQEMRGDVERQREARTAAERLAEQFGQGPDGQPLDPDAARELEDVAEAMQGAARALDRNDPLESARLQEEAARRLTELRERLEQPPQGGGGGGGESGMEMDSRRPVEIPDADEFEGPMEMRRRLLDAMREAPPAGYEDAVRQYYEGLLR